MVKDRQQCGLGTCFAMTVLGMHQGFFFAPVTCQITASHNQPLQPSRQKTDDVKIGRHMKGWNLKIGCQKTC